MKRARNFTRNTAIFLFLLLGIAGLASCNWLDDGPWTAPESAKELKNPVKTDVAVLADARAIYDDNCVRCHGDTGNGDGADASQYNPPPASLSDPKRMRGITDGELFWKITEGRRPMPSFQKQLTDRQRWELVDLIRTFSAPDRQWTGALPAGNVPTK